MPLVGTARGLSLKACLFLGAVCGAAHKFLIRRRALAEKSRAAANRREETQCGEDRSQAAAARSISDTPTTMHQGASRKVFDTKNLRGSGLV